ncbi:transposase [Massilia varians]
MARERRLFLEEFKREAVKLVGQPGASEAAIARDLGIGASLLGRWCRDANVDAEVTGGPEKVLAQEYERMRRELAKVRTERDILKKALGYFAADLK